MPVRRLRLHVEADLAARYLGSRLVADGHSVAIEEVTPGPLSEFNDLDEQAFETHIVRIASIIRSLPTQLSTRRRSAN